MQSQQRLAGGSTVGLWIEARNQAWRGLRNSPLSRKRTALKSDRGPNTVSASVHLCDIWEVAETPEFHLSHVEMRELVYSQ